MTSYSITTEYLDSQIKTHDFTKTFNYWDQWTSRIRKTYLTNQLNEYLKKSYPNFNIVQFSMDDVYLTKQDQDKLNNSTDNPLLKGRGLPGTHDLATLMKFSINQLKIINQFGKI